jgi:hypothetical protein
MGEPSEPSLRPGTTLGALPSYVTFCRSRPTSKSCTLTLMPLRRGFVKTIPLRLGWRLAHPSPSSASLTSRTLVPSSLTTPRANPSLSLHFKSRRSSLLPSGRTPFTYTKGLCPAWLGTPASRTPVRCSLTFTILEVAITSKALSAVALC